MKKIATRLLKNDLFLMMLNAMLAYLMITATIIAILQTPSDNILDSGLTEIILVFEDFADGGVYE